MAETPDVDGAYPRLTDAQLAELERYGERRPTTEGEVLIREGEHAPAFYVITGGEVAVVDGYGTSRERTLGVHGPGRFLGELALVIGQPAFITSVVREAGEVLAVPPECLHDVAVRDARLGDLIMRAYLARREMLISLGAGLRIIGSRFSPDTRRLRDFAARNRLPHRWLDLERDPSAEALLDELGIRPDETPVVVWSGTKVLRNPDNADLAREIGLPVPADLDIDADLLVVGAGPAGLAAAVYGASEGLTTVALDGVAPGGQAATSSRIENYLGFPAGISGAELAERAIVQAEKFGARISVPGEAVGLDQEEGYHVVRLADGRSLRGRTVLVVTGARYRRLDVPGMERLEEASVYYAATEIEAHQCAPDPVAVVGGGNSAGQAALFLADHVAHVYLLIREDALTANMSHYLADRIEKNPKIEVRPHTELRELRGDRVLEQLVVTDTRTREESTLDVRSLFVFIGATPHARWLGDQVALDERGFVLTGPEAAQNGVAREWEDLGRQPFFLETSRPGVFAAGDVRSGSIKRMASAVGEGSMAVRLVHEYLMR
ncbi:MAG TPA: FAD-dependent oxidoreductase [Mycobacteriales bacterium]|jgi:thioredoxin reductase (NADPH)|nr:FAD-dependent oxidoreductase [Mycobacteriales bacterium]